MFPYNCQRYGTRKIRAPRVDCRVLLSLEFNYIEKLKKGNQKYDSRFKKGKPKWSTGVKVNLVSI